MTVRCWAHTLQLLHHDLVKKNKYAKDAFAAASSLLAACWQQD